MNVQLFKLHHRVTPRGLAKPSGAHFWRPLLCVEVHVHQPEPVTEAGRPFEVVHRAPVEIAFDRYTLGCRALQLGQVGADEHDAVGVVDVAVIGELIFAGAAVLGDENLLRLPE